MRGRVVIGIWPVQTGERDEGEWVHGWLGGWREKFVRHGDECGVCG